MSYYTIYRFSFKMQSLKILFKKIKYTVKNVVLILRKNNNNNFRKIRKTFLVAR